MKSSLFLSRREFIQIGAGAAAAAGLLSPADVLAAAKPNWPVGCRDVYLKFAGPDAWTSMKALGAEGIEVDVAIDLSCPNLHHKGRKYTLATEDGLCALRDDLAANQCAITAFMMANHLDERLEQEIEWTRRLVKAADHLGVHIIRIDVVPRKLSGEEFLPFAIKACRQMCDAAEGTRIRFGVENHGKITNDPNFLEKLFDGVGSQKLGLTLDCANFYWWGHPLKNLYSIYEKFAPRAVHTHCKSIKYPADRKNVQREMGWEYGKYNCPIYEGDIDFKRVVRILRKAKYQGDLCLEDESLGKFPEPERAGVLKREIELLKKLA